MSQSQEGICKSDILPARRTKRALAIAEQFNQGDSLDVPLIFSATIPVGSQ